MIIKGKSEKIFSASIILLVLNIVASATNYICQIMFAHVLSVPTYGELNVIFSFMMVVAVPGTTLTMIVARNLAGANVDRTQYIKGQERMVTLCTIAISTLLFFLIKYIGRMMDISDGWVLILAIILASTGFFHPLYSGVFSGNKRFILVGIYSLFIPIYKIIAIIVAYMYSTDDRKRLIIILVIMLIGVMATALFGKKQAGKFCNNINFFQKKKLQELYKIDDFYTLILNLSIMLYMNLDLFVIRYRTSEVESGLYSSVLLFGRIIYYFSTTLGTVLLPIVASEKTVEKRKIHLNRNLLLLLGVVIVCILPINIFKEQLIESLFGKSYLDAEKYVIYVSLISIALSMYTILINYDVGIGNAKKVTGIMMGIDFVLLAIAFGITNIQTTLLLIAGVGVIGAIIVYFISVRERPSIDGRK